MPVYEYKCKKCMKTFEKLQKAGEDGRNLFCPACGEGEPQKLISSFSSKVENSCSTSGFS